MFGLGLIEIVAICLVALIFIRPKDLPALLRKIGRLYRNVTDQIDAAKRIVREIEHSDGDSLEVDAQHGQDIKGE